MISNEFGLVFLDIPYSGFNILNEVLTSANSQTKFDDTIIEDAIEYEYIALVKNPYHRAVAIYQNGCKLRKNLKLKSQTFTEYFENNLNKWDTVDGDMYDSQESYFPDETEVNIFQYEAMLENWTNFNEYITVAGLNSIKYYVDPDPIKKWESHYDDKIAIELVNYIFENDFDRLGYTKL
jgi:hypothetical protein